MAPASEHMSINASHKKNMRVHADTPQSHFAPQPLTGGEKKELYLGNYLKTNPVCTGAHTMVYILLM